MELYINGSSAISAYGTRAAGSGETQPGFIAREPDYREIIDVRSLRRMSRIMRMALATARGALSEAQFSAPDAIITATGLGCLEDTGNFLTKMCDPENRMMNPTAFIQSIHNTMGGLIAMQLGVQGYNNTVTQDVLSFEQALLDSVLLLEENPGLKILLGGIDELTPLKQHLTERLARAMKQDPDACAQGEGGSFFCLSSNPGKVKLQTLLFSGPGDAALIREYIAEVSNRAVKTLLLSGRCGNADDSAYARLPANTLPLPEIRYRYLCGDYPTSAAFAFWLGNQILTRQLLPENVPAETQEILIWHAYAARQHSLIHLSAC
jgi:3-oxoacyl-[acyl-carrier-protein] synthase II